MTGPAARSTRHLAGAGAILLACGWLAHVPPASATPKATLKMRAVPIPGFPGTGAILGAGSGVEAQVTITGHEYGTGFPSPLTGINFYAPAGVRLTSTGFPTCALTVLEDIGAEGCPRGSHAGPRGEGFGATAFGAEEVPEKVSIESFFAPGGLTFFVVGHTPALFEIVERAHWVAARPPFGKELMIEVPLIATVPNAPYASVLSFKVTVGAAYRRGGRTISYITQPRRCPTGGFPVKMELSFLSSETVTVNGTVACPRH
jgi:hypothetical protein